MIGSRPFSTRTKPWPIDPVFVSPFNRRFYHVQNTARVFEHPYLDRGLGAWVPRITPRAARRIAGPTRISARPPATRTAGPIPAWKPGDTSALQSNALRSGRGMRVGRFAPGVAGVNGLGSWLSSFVNHNKVLNTIGTVALNFVPVVGPALSIATAAALKSQYAKKAKQDYNASVDAWLKGEAIATENARKGTLVVAPPKPAAAASGGTLSTQPITRVSVKRRPFALSGLGDVDSEIGAFFTDSGSSWNWGNFVNNAAALVNAGANAYSQIKSAGKSPSLPSPQLITSAPATSPNPAPQTAAVQAAPSSSSMLIPLAVAGLALLALKK